MTNNLVPKRNWYSKLSDAEKVEAITKHGVQGLFDIDLYEIIEPMARLLSELNGKASIAAPANAAAKKKAD